MKEQKTELRTKSGLDALANMTGRHILDDPIMNSLSQEERNYLIQKFEQDKSAANTRLSESDSSGNRFFGNVWILFIVFGIVAYFM